MLIANPIYDVVFKYLLEDETCAKLLLGEILHRKILSLKLLPQESIVPMSRENAPPLTVYRLDFAAEIVDETDKQKKVLIEIQKAKYASDIERFRRYLGDQYRQGDLPIITIYFLGYPLQRITTPVVRVARNYIDVAENREIKEREVFIESLTHDSYVIQIPYLSDRKRNDLERLLTVFDQSHDFGEDRRKHVMMLNEEELPERFHPLLRRLQKAQETTAIKRTMDIEDEILSELADKDRHIGNLENRVRENKKTLEENKKALEEKDKALEENKKTLEKKDKALEEKDKALEDQKHLIEELKKKIQE